MNLDIRHNDAEAKLFRPKTQEDYGDEGSNERKLVENEQLLRKAS